MNTVLIAVVTSAVTTMFVDFTMRPRLEARKARLLAVHAYRDQFAASVLSIHASCGRLSGTQEIKEDPDLAGILPEHDRWRNKIEESTLWLIDNMEFYAFNYPKVGGIPELLTRYAFIARGVWLSERSEADKIDILAEMSEYVREIFFAFWWSRAAHTYDRRKKLVAVLDRVSGAGTLASQPLAQRQE